ncbi:MAG: hypothetical protein HRT67_06245 [Flavobacteriaceae bacterium]|nr:hypothetical protein [Flavobacteriaceae bacterium]
MKNKPIDLFGHNLTTNEEIDSKEILDQFLAPFSKELKDEELTADFLDFTLNVWNIANIREITLEHDHSNIEDYIENNNYKNLALFKKMIDYKVANFKEYDNFIVDYELVEAGANGNPTLNIITKEKKTYLANLMDEFENQMDEENYINRNAIVLKAQQPFIDWSNSIYPDSVIDESQITESNIYLVDNGIKNIEAWLRKIFDKFFIMELKDWSQKRNYKMFKRWFKIETSHMIYDLEKEPVEKHD